jgi:hypothetical protein
MNDVWHDPCCNSVWWGPTEQGRPGKGTTLSCFTVTPSILFFANFLTSALTSESGFHAFFLAGFQVKGVALDLFNNVFLLHFALETAQRIFEGFTLLQSNFRQTDTPPNPSGRTE